MVRNRKCHFIKSKIGIKLCFLLCAVFIAVSGLYSKQRIIHPNWAPRTIELDSENITTIMGYRAELSGNLVHADHPSAFPIKDALVYGFIAREDIMTWSVCAPRDGKYIASVLYCGAKGVIDQCKIELRSGRRIIQENAHSPTWEGKPFFQRHYFEKALPLIKGENEISLRLVDIPESQIEAAKKALSQGKSNRLRDDSFCIWSIELVETKAHKKIKKRAKAMRADIDWMVKGKYGLFVHWSPLIYPLYGGTKLRDNYQEMVENFDAEAFADVVAQTGASWVCLTTSHGGHYWPGPNKTIDRILPGRSCQRDLIRDLIDALADHNIRLMLYYHFGWAETGDPEWAKAIGMTDQDPQRWFGNIESLFREVSLRYGKDLVSTAAYIDDCGFIAYQYDPPWELWARAIKAGNPNAPIGFSQSWGPVVSPFGEFQMTDGGGRLPTLAPSHLFKKQGQFESLYRASWFNMDGWVRSKTIKKGIISNGPKLAAEQYIQCFKNLDQADVPATINLVITADVTRKQPFFNPECVEVMRKVRIAVKGK